MAFNYSPKIVTDDLVLCLDAANPRSYPGSGTIWSDISRRGNSGVLTNGPTYNSANGGSIVFDGIDDFSTSGNIGTINAFTISIWFYPTSVTNYENPIDCNYNFNGIAGNVGPRLEMYDIGRLVWVWSGDTTGNSNFYVSDALESGLISNTWHNAVISRSSDNSILNYLDGELKTTAITTFGTPSATFVNVFSNVTIGKGFSIGGAERIYTGRVANTLIYNRALSLPELNQNYNATRTRFGL